MKSYMLFSGVRQALKNARGSALSASPAVPSVEKCKKNEAERQPSGAPAAGLERNFNTEAERWNLRLSVELPDFMYLLF